MQARSGFTIARRFSRMQQRVVHSWRGGRRRAGRRSQPGAWRLLAALALLLGTGETAAAKQLRLEIGNGYPALSAGFLIAEQLGFYEAAGIDIEFVETPLPLSVPGDGLASLANGTADLVIGGTEVLAGSRPGSDLVAVFTIFQTSPARLFVKSQREVLGAIDLPNLRMIRPRSGSRLDIETAALLAANGISVSEMQYVQGQTGTGALAQILSEDIDGFPGSLVATRYILEELGVKLSPIEPSSYGLDFYGDTVFARGDFARRNPDLLAGFIEASRRGWTHVFEEPDDTIRRMMAAGPDIAVLPEMVNEADFLAWQIDKMARLAGWPVVELGSSSPVRWRRIEAALVELDLIDEPVVDADFVFDPQRLALQSQQLQTRRALLAGGAALVIVLLAGVVLLGVGRLRTQHNVQALFHGLLHAVAVVRLQRGDLRVVTSNEHFDALAGTVGLRAGSAVDPVLLLTSLGLREPEREIRSVMARRVQVQRDLKAPDHETYYSLSLFPVGRTAVGMAMENVTASYVVSSTLEELVHQRTVTIREIHHRVRNNMQIISSMMQLQAGRHPTPEVQKVTGTAQHQIRALSLAHEMLYDDFDSQSVDLDAYLRRVAHETADLLPLSPEVPVPPRIVGQSPEAVRLVDLDTAIPLGLIVSEAVANAVEHAFTAGPGTFEVAGPSLELSVEGGSEPGAGDGFSVVIRDNGRGFDPEAAGDAGLGLQLMELLARQCGAEARVDSRPGEGTRICVTSDAAGTQPRADRRSPQAGAAPSPATRVSDLGTGA